MLGRHAPPGRPIHGRALLPHMADVRRGNPKIPAAEDGPPKMEEATSNVREAREAKEANEANEVREAREVRAASEIREVRAASEIKEVREVQAGSEVREAKDPRDVRDLKGRGVRDKSVRPRCWSRRKFQY